MTYQNTKTGFVFNSPCEVKGEGWVKLNPSPSVEEKPVKTKRVKKDDKLRNND